MVEQAKQAPSTARLLTLLQAQEQTGISQHTLRRHVQNSKIRHVRNGKVILIPLAEIDRIVAKGLPSTAK